MESPQPTVHVIDDDAAVRESLKWLMESVSRKVRLHESAESFLTGYDPETAGCVISDMRMPQWSGLQLLAELRARDYRIPTIILTAHGDVSTAVRAMKAGAYDFLEKPVNNQSLLDLVDSAIGRDRERRRARQALALTMEKFETLSRREKETMEMVADGHSNKQIARDLNISPKTVEAHRSSLMRKMGASSVAEIVRLAAVCYANGEDTAEPDRRES